MLQRFARGAAAEQITHRIQLGGAERTVEFQVEIDAVFLAEDVRGEVLGVQTRGFHGMARQVFSR